LEKRKRLSARQIHLIKETINEEEFKMEYIPLWERDARKEGEKRGEKKGKEETAKELIKRGVDMDIIEGATGISREELEKMTSNVQ